MIGAMDKPADDLFTEHETPTMRNLIQYSPALMNPHMVAASYADAALRLARSYTGQPWDDVMLLPSMFLWRQAIELEIKRTIKRLTELRVENGETSSELMPKAVSRRLQFKIGHDLRGLLAELEEDIDALTLQPLPAPVTKTLLLLAELDNGGTSFRYPYLLQTEGRNLDFASLTESLSDAFDLLSVVIDAATNGEG